jgi:hypothetical protein
VVVNFLNAKAMLHEWCGKIIMGNDLETDGLKIRLFFQNIRGNTEEYHG